MRRRFSGIGRAGTDQARGITQDRLGDCDLPTQHLQLAHVLPVGPTAFTRPLTLGRTQPLDGDLYRVTADATVAAGRSWLAEELLPSLLKERADNELIVHGPVVLPSDEQAATRFARAERLLQARRRR